MFTWIRRRATYANVAMSLALLFAMTGGAYAAKKYLITSTKQISPSVLKALAGKPGPAGAAGPQGPAGPQGLAGAAGAKGEIGGEGKQGLQGNEGPTGPKGATGPTGPKGATGEPWTAGGTLPSGKTETGTWSIPLFGITVERGPGSETSISFPIPLAATGQAFVFTKAQTENKEFGSSGCSGNVETPSAPPGKLCVYTGYEILKNVTGVLAAYPAESGKPPGFGVSGVVLAGQIFEGEPIAPAEAQLRGAWAVTAP